MANFCGACRFFRVVETREDSRVGNCRLERVMGVFREDMAACSAFSLPGETALPNLSAHRSSGGRRQASSVESLASVPATVLSDALYTQGPDNAKSALGRMIDNLVVMPKRPRQALCVGTLILKPADGDLKPKDVPLSQLFQKAFAIRDNLRILEQKINSAAALDQGLTLLYHSQITQLQANVLAFCCGWQTKSSQENSDDVAAVLDDLICERQRNAMRLRRPSLGEKWRGGTALYEMEGASFSEPMSRFFHRLVIMRDGLLALEASLRAETGLEPAEIKVMTGYLARSHGSLTTFNVLFKSREEYFSSGR